MAHPYYHSLSSVRMFGGQYTDYMPIHHWLDASKAITTHFSHRALRHHDYGIKMLQRVMDRQKLSKDGLLINSDGTPVVVEHVARQHVIEDCGFVPTIEQWFDTAAITSRFGEPTLTDGEVAEKTAKVFGGSPANYMVFSTVQDAAPWWYSAAFWYHSFGLFAFEEAIGPVIQIGAGVRPTRSVAETWTSYAVKTKTNVWGAIADSRSVLHYLQLKGNHSWMHGHAQKLSEDRSLRKFSTNAVEAGV